MKSLSSILYKNNFTSTFPGDESGDLSPRQTPGVLYSKAIPTPVKAPALIGWSDDLARELEISKPVEQIDIDILAGNFVAPTMYPYAACYAGHQFGNWAGQLGDGRAITLGEIETSAKNTWELQLKGAGPTPYSRRADGRAVLRSSVREYLMSEAMYYLGVPTTRALSLVSTGDQVLRDMFYDGRAEYEPGAIVMRVAPSFLRFGNFEMLAARKETNHLKKLVDWTINRYYPHITGDNKVVVWFKEIAERTASLIIEWLRVGFVHGVMNTDNMSVLGLTIDYGPYSFLDEFDFDFTPNTTDLPGRRYAFGQQGYIAQWNLSCLAGAIAPLVSDSKLLLKEIEGFGETYYLKYYTMMSNKLGLDEFREDDIALIKLFEKGLDDIKPDMTIFYQLLADLPAESEHDTAAISEHFKQSFYQDLKPQQNELLIDLIANYRNRIKQNSCSAKESITRMRQSNPRFILRNYLLHQAIEELAKGENKLFLELQQAIKNPYSTDYNKFYKKRPDWASEKAGCSMLSCSS